MRNNSNKVVLNSALVVVGFVFNKAITFLMIPIFTRMLTTSDYGKVSTYTAWMAILAYIVGMALEYSVRNAYVDFHEDMNKYMSSICSLSLVGLFVIGGFVLGLNELFFHQMNLMLSVCCIIHAYVHSLINYINMVLTMKEQYVKRVLLLLLPNLLSSILGIVFIANMASDKYMGRVLGYIIVFLPLGVWLLYHEFKIGKTFYQQKYWMYALTISLPMVAHGLSNVVLNHFDRILLSTMRSDSEAGIYSLVYNFSMISIAITTAMENIWIPWFTKKIVAKQHTLINRMAKLYVYLIVAIICGILMVAPEFLMLMSSKEYWSGKIIIVPIVISSYVIFLYSLQVAEEIYYKTSKITAINTFIAAVFNFVTDCMVIPQYGMLGAAYTTLASYIISFILHYRYGRKLNKALFPFSVYFVPSIIVIIMGVISYVEMDNWIIRWSLAILIATACLVGFLNKDKIIDKFIYTDN